MVVYTKSELPISEKIFKISWGLHNQKQTSENMLGGRMLGQAYHAFMVQFVVSLILTLYVLSMVNIFMFI